MLRVVGFGVRKLVDVLKGTWFFLWNCMAASARPCTHQKLDLFLARKRDNAIMAPFDRVDTRWPACYRCRVRHVLLVEQYICRYAAYRVAS
jgi:hypothetical protein